MAQRGVGRIGPKNLFGAGESRIPAVVECRRKYMREAWNESQSAARQKQVDKLRNNTTDVVGTTTTTTTNSAKKQCNGSSNAVMDEDDEQRRELLRRLEEYKARKAKLREELRSKTRPFICGIAPPPKTPSKSPAAKLSTTVASFSKKADKSGGIQSIGNTPKKVVPVASANKPNKSNIPAPQIRTKKAGDAGTSSNIPKPKLLQANTNKPQSSSSQTLNKLTFVPAQIEEVKNESEITATLNATFDIVPPDVTSKVNGGATAGNFSIAEISVKSSERDTKMDISGQILETDDRRRFSSPDRGEIKPDVWKPNSTSSPCKENDGPTVHSTNSLSNKNAKPWHDGFEPTFRFNHNHDLFKNDVPNWANEPRPLFPSSVFSSIHIGDGDRSGKVPGKRVESPNRPPNVNVDRRIGGGMERHFVPIEAGDDGSSTDGAAEEADVVSRNDATFELPPPRRRSGESGGGDDDGPRRRSSRSTRYTGSFAGQDKPSTPRRRRQTLDIRNNNDDDDACPQRIERANSPRIDIGDGEEGILEVSTPVWPDSLDSTCTTDIASSITGDTNAVITTDMANLTLTSSTWADRSSTKFDSDSDDDEAFLTAQLGPQLSNHRHQQQQQDRRRSFSDGDLTASCNRPDDTTNVSSIFNGPPTTPMSILRKYPSCTSTQKKTVRFRMNDIESPTHIWNQQQQNAAAAATPASHFVLSFAPRRSFALSGRGAQNADDDDDDDDMIKW